jgi:hypothetical protein
LALRTPPGERSEITCVRGVSRFSFLLEFCRLVRYRLVSSHSAVYRTSGGSVPRKIDAWRKEGCLCGPLLFREAPEFRGIRRRGTVIADVRWQNARPRATRRKLGLPWNAHNPAPDPPQDPILRNPAQPHSGSKGHQPDGWTGCGPRTTAGRPHCAGCRLARPARTADDRRDPHVPLTTGGTRTYR